MVSGKPYISVKSATRNAEKPPKARQSRRVRGWVKLSAKKMNTAELITTSDQRPYAGAAGVTGSLLSPVTNREYVRRRCEPVRHGPGAKAGETAGRQGGAGRATRRRRVRGA